MSSTSPRLAQETPTGIAGRRVLVVGLGRFGGGVGVTQWLVAQGADVTVTDLASQAALGESLEKLAGLEVTFRLGGHDDADLDSVDWVVLNPAIDRRRSPFFQAIKDRRIPWTTEINLFCQRCPCRVIGVTGTYGKSTTCAMLADSLEACRRSGGASFTGTYLGGNIGRSLLGDLDRMRPTDLVVLELSNAQLEGLPRIDWAPTIAVVTNLSPHHLDRYDGYAEYVATKLNIIGSSAQTLAVVVGNLEKEADASVARRLSGGAPRLIRTSDLDPALVLRVPGEHNRHNAGTALTVCRHLGLDDHTVAQALREFSGLPHRLEHVRTLDGVDYYNDSKSTSPAATVTALQTLQRPGVVILGGQKTQSDQAALVREAASRCHTAICLGESGPPLAHILRERSAAMVIHTADGLTAATRIAQEAAQAGDVVLFSPGAPSFDTHANFADRGRRFVESVRSLTSRP